MAHFRVCAPFLELCSASAAQLGIFQGQGDVGTVLHPGSASYDAARQSYTVTGSGDNMWFGTDDFQFAWKKVSGDVAISSADIAFMGEKGNNHRKAVLMIRQSLDGEFAAVDIARHGDGLTSLQFRDAEGADDSRGRVQCRRAKTVGIEKHGDYFYAFVSGADGKLAPVGCVDQTGAGGPFYVGIGVCAHDKDATETAVFSNVKLARRCRARRATRPLTARSRRSPIASTDRRRRVCGGGAF